MITYNRTLAGQVASLLTKKWGTGLLVPLDMSANMINVILPSTDPLAVEYMQKKLDAQYDIYLIYSSVPSSESSLTLFYTRLSMQMYLELSDFEKIVDLVPQLLQEFHTNLAAATTIPEDTSN